jgi:hypothetical protein
MLPKILRNSVLVGFSPDSGLQHFKVFPTSPQKKKKEKRKKKTFQVACSVLSA